jgi:hypothetical protein
MRMHVLVVYAAFTPLFVPSLPYTMLCARMQGAGININSDTLAIFLRMLASSAALMPTDLLEEFKLLQVSALQMFPELSQVGGVAVEWVAWDSVLSLCG